MKDKENLNSFTNSLEKYDWFCDAEMSDYNKFIVYVDKMDLNFISSVPDKIDGHEILFHFIGSQPTSKAKSCHYCPAPTIKTLSVCSSHDKGDIREALSNESSDEDEIDLDQLKLDLGTLIAKYGINLVENIFHEIHDNEYAITNYGDKHLALKNSIEFLYQHYGFDLIFELFN